jgi:CubicO group peptidase (beta-lactamase class C family)
MSIKKILFYSMAVLVGLILAIELPTSLAQGKAVPENTVDNVSYEEIDAYIEQKLKALNIPGASLAIVEGDKIVHTKGFGVTSPGGKAPTPQTPYFIGSLTKSFTALAIMQLVETSKVELDAPVQRYLPWFTLVDPQAAAQITVRHLLNQTSGLSQIPGMIALGNFDDSPGVMERQAGELAAFKPARPAGSAFEYSNSNFNLLGLVVEAASGEAYADYIQNHIYAPLDMQHSHTSKAAARQDGLAVGYRMWFGYPFAAPELPAPAGSLPSGQLIASAEDMAHYLIAQLNGGKYAGAQVLSPEGVAQMHKPATEVTAFNEKMGNYGMGWFIIKPHQKRIVFHDGETPDYFSYMALLPEQNRAMVLLVNANEQAFNYALWALAEAAALWLAGVPPQSDSWGILPWAMRGSLLLPILQIGIIIATLRKVKRWRLGVIPRPGSTRMWLLHILLPTVLNLALAAIAGAILASGMFKFIMLFMGDIVSVLLVSGGIALVWLIVRTPLIFRSLRMP